MHKEINKQPSPKWHVLCTIQNGSSSVTVILSLLMPKNRKKFQGRGTVETQLLKRKHLFDQKNSPCVALACFENLSKYPPSSGNKQCTLAGRPSLTFFYKEST